MVRIRGMARFRGEVKSIASVRVMERVRFGATIRVRVKFRV